MYNHFDNYLYPLLQKHIHRQPPIIELFSILLLLIGQLDILNKTKKIATITNPAIAK